MLDNIFYAPSFYSHILNSFFMVLAMVILYKNYASIRVRTPYQLVTLYLLLSIAVGIHGISHLGLEKIYDFYPIRDG
jgi:hypothetical protein